MFFWKHTGLLCFLALLEVGEMPKKWCFWNSWRTTFYCTSCNQR